jgi:hypothetical protein
LTTTNQMKLENVVADWQTRADRLRHQRDFCREHRFLLEATALGEKVELLQALLTDLQITLLPIPNRPAPAATPYGLPQTELLFLANLLTQAAALAGQRVCDDLDPGTVAMLTERQRAELMTHYNLWNSGEAEPDDYFMGHLGAWLSFYAARFHAQAELEET